MKIYKASRMVSILLIAAMLFTMTGVSAFAAGEDETPETKNILVFGASTSSGYGLPDFLNENCGYALDNNDLTTFTMEEAAKYNTIHYVPDDNGYDKDDHEKGRISNFSYPWQLKEYIANTEFNGDLKKVKLNPVTMNGMRTDELHALLDENYYEAVFEQEKRVTRTEFGNDVDNDIGFLSNHVKSFVRSFWDCEAIQGERNSVRPRGAAYRASQAFLRKEIEDADVIVVDCCMNNFGTYMAERIAGKHNVPSKEYAAKYYLQKREDIVGVTEKTLEATNKLEQMLTLAMPLLSDDNAKEFLEAFLYCYADFVTNFDADIELIRELNPKATIVTVGVYNTLDGINLIIGNQTIDFGEIAAMGFNLVNAHIKGLSANSNTYYFADVTSGEGIETFMNQIRNAKDNGGFEALMADEYGKPLMDNMYESFIESFVNKNGVDNLSGIVENQAKDYFNTNIRDAQSAALGMKEWNNLSDDETVSFNHPTYGTMYITVEKSQTTNENYTPNPNEDGMTYVTKNYIRSVVRATIKERVQLLLYKAGIVTDINLTELMRNLKDMDAVSNDIMSALINDTDPEKKTMELLHIVDRFILYQGVGQHPSKSGVEAMAEDVITAYKKSQDGGNTAYEDFKEKLLSLLDGTPAADEIKDLLKMKEDAKPLLENMGEIERLFQVMKDYDLNADQLKELLELKKEYEGKMTAILNALGLNVEDLDKELSDISDNKDGKLDKLVEKYNQLQELMEIIDEEGLTPDQLKQLLQIRDDLVNDMNQVLYAFDLTADDLKKMLDETANDKTKMDEIVKKVNMLKEVMEIIDEENLTPDQLKQLLETKNKLQKRVDEILVHYGVTIDDLEKMLDDVTIEQIDEYVEKLTQIKEVMDLLDKEGLTVDQLKQLLLVKDDLVKDMNQVLDAFDLTADELKDLMHKTANDEKKMKEIVEKVNMLKEVMEIIDEENLTPEQLKQLLETKNKLQKRVDEILDHYGVTLDDLEKMLNDDATLDQIDEYVKKLAQVKEALDLLEKEGLTVDQLKDLLTMKDELADDITKVLEAFDLTADELKDLMHETANDEEKMAEIVKKVNMLKEVMEIIDEEELTPEQLKQFLETKDKLAERVVEILKHYDLTLEDLEKALNDDATLEEIDKYIEKLAQIKEAMDLLDEEGLTVDQLKQFLETKDKLAERVGEILKHYDLTLEDLEKALNDDATLEEIDKYIEKLAQIKEAMDLLDEEGLTVDQLKEALQIKEDLEARINDTLDSLGLTMDDVIKAIDENTTPEKLAEYIEKYKQISEILYLIDESGIDADQIKELLDIKDQIWQRIQTAQEFINEKIKQYISDELLEQIKEIGNKLINATDAEDYEQILKDLAPILDRLKEIGLAVYNLPEYEEAMDAYAELLDQFAEEAVDMRDEIDTLKSQIKTYEKKLEEQDAKFAELTAKTIFVNMKTAVKFPKKTVQVVVSWDAEADAAGYVLKVNGKEKAAVATAKGFQYKDNDVKVGKTTTYEVTPFVEYKGEKLYGRTYTKKVTPKVSLKKVTLKKVKGAKKALKIKWKKVAKANGYQVSYKVGKKTQYKNVKGAKKVTLNLKKLQGGKEYTVKVRAWKKVDGKKYYGKWSAAKKATTEK